MTLKNNVSITEWLTKIKEESEEYAESEKDTTYWQMILAIKQCAIIVEAQIKETWKGADKE